MTFPLSRAIGIPRIPNRIKKGPVTSSPFAIVAARPTKMKINEKRELKAVRASHPILFNKNRPSIIPNRPKITRSPDPIKKFP